MRASELLEQHTDEIKLIAKRYEPEGVKNLRVFGSVARGEDTERSDIDFLVDAEPEVTLLTLGGLYFELEELLGRRIDLLTVDNIPETVMPRIVSEARPI